MIIIAVAHFPRKLEPHAGTVVLSYSIKAEMDRYLTKALIGCFYTELPIGMRVLYIARFAFRPGPTAGSKAFGKLPGSKTHVLQCVIKL